MKFTTLKIENFLTIGEINANLSDKGLVLIQGENLDDTSQDSNGSGKSSIPDAISWCLFGTTARGETGDAVINRTAKKGCMVEVHLDDNGTKYLIRRHRKHKVGKNRLTIYDMSKAIELTRGTDKLTQPLVEQILGCSQEVFNAAVYTGQDAMPDLPGMTDKMLKTLVEESAGIDRLQAANMIANSNFSEAKREYDANVDEQRRIGEQIAQNKQDVKDAQQSVKSWDENKKTRVDAAMTKLKESENQLEKLKASIDVAQYKSNKKNLKEAEFAISGIKSEQKHLADLAKKLTRTEMAHKTSETELNAYIVSHAKAEEELNTKDFDAIKGTPCKTCKKPHDSSDADLLRDKATENVKRLKGFVDEAVVLRDRTSKKLTQARTEHDNFADTMTDIADETATAGVLRGLIADTELTLRTIKQQQAEVEQNVDNVDNIGKEINPHLDLEEKLKKRIKSTLSKQKSAARAGQDLELSVRLRKAATQVFGPAGVRAHILDTVTPFLNERTNHYLSILSDANLIATWSTLSTTAKGELREKFGIDVSSKVGSSGFKGLSGGEKRKVRLSCAMALQDLVASRATKKIELFIADEVDHALDEAGLERLMTILDEKGRQNGTVLTISHNSLSDWIRQSVTVVKENGYSTLQGGAL